MQFRLRWWHTPVMEHSTGRGRRMESSRPISVIQQNKTMQYDEGQFYFNMAVKRYFCFLNKTWYMIVIKISIVKVSTVVNMCLSQSWPPVLETFR
jgi:hypothetical protein